MKQMMRWIQLPGVSLLAILVASGCKKVAPEKVITQNNIQITSFVGAGGSFGGFLDGTGEKTLFQNPNNLVMDAAGNMYATDEFNNRIRKITPEGVVSTFAGTGEGGYVDGNGAQAKFSLLEGLAIDKSGNIYVADNNNNVVRKISSAGIVSTYAGTPNTVSYYSARYDGPAASAVFGPGLSGLAVDPSGNVYLSDPIRNFIWKITPAGNASTWIGDGQAAFSGKSPFRDGYGPSAEICYPTAITYDTSSGNFYLADTNNNRIRKITPDGYVNTVAGNGIQGEVDGALANAQLNLPAGVVTDATGNVYFSQYNKIRKIETFTTSTNIDNTWNNPQSWGNPR